MNFFIDTLSGVPIYRQIIEQIRYAVARGELKPGNQLPTVRQLAVDLSINPNTVVRAYRELEIEGLLDSQQGSGTFISNSEVEIDEEERRRMIDQITTGLLTRAASYGFTLEDILNALRQRQETSS